MPSQWDANVAVSSGKSFLVNVYSVDFVVVFSKISWKRFCCFSFNCGENWHDPVKCKVGLKKWPHFPCFSRNMNVLMLALKRRSTGIARTSYSLCDVIAVAEKMDKEVWWWQWNFKLDCSEYQGIGLVFMFSPCLDCICRVGESYQNENKSSSLRLSFSSRVNKCRHLVGNSMSMSHCCDECGLNPAVFLVNYFLLSSYCLNLPKRKKEKKR